MSTVATHELKTWPAPFQGVWEGLKSFELRKDDRGYALGDHLRLLEWTPAHEGRCSWRSHTDEMQTTREDIYCSICGRNIDAPLEGVYTGRSILAEVSYLLRAGAFPGLEAGYVVLGLVVRSKHRRQDQDRQNSFSW